MATSVDYWAGGVVKVELTDQQRRAFGAVVRATAPELIAGIERDDAALTGPAAQRLLAALASPRSRLPLWETLPKGATGHGKRATTVRLYRRSALVWSRLLLVAAAGVGEWHALPNEECVRLVITACKLVLAATARPGKRPRVADVLVAHAVASNARPGAVKRAAELLDMDESAVRCAILRVKRRPITALVEAVAFGAVTVLSQ